MICGGAEGGGGGSESISDGGDDRSTSRYRRRGDGREKGEGSCGDDKLGEGGGPVEGGFGRGAAGGGVHMAGGGPDTHGEKGIPRHWPREGDVEDSGSYFKSLAHILNYLQQLPPWILGRSRHRHHHA